MNVIHPNKRQSQAVTNTRTHTYTQQEREKETHKHTHTDCGQEFLPGGVCVRVCVLRRHQGCCSSSKLEERARRSGPVRRAEGCCVSGGLWRCSFMKWVPPYPPSLSSCFQHTRQDKRIRTAIKATAANAAQGPRDKLMGNNALRENSPTHQVPESRSSLK